ncbi:MAG TPA: RbsD/FucU domain-containing protein [Alloacidobacterium sp.]|jgi:D-ribose pyranase|nr:RbsD/FucU domain-containing protein [Alloacidobacterium sp.]
MLNRGILNPHINSLLARVRHTNTLVIADRGFPYWPMIETVDISLVDDVPRVLEVLRAIRDNYSISRIFMAEEFRQQNTSSVVLEFTEAMKGVEVQFEPHVALKTRVPQAIGLIRTADTIQYANMIVESG